MHILLNHVILGDIVDIKHPYPQGISTLEGTPLSFTEYQGRTNVNGVPLTGEEFNVQGGKVVIIDGLLALQKGAGGRSFSSVGTQMSNVVTESTSKEKKKEFIQLVEVGEEKAGGVTASGSRPTRFQKFHGKPNEFEAEALSEGEFENEEFLNETSTFGPGESFIESFLREIKAAGTREFFYHFEETNCSHFFASEEWYTALVASDDSFYSYYPIDWGFNPFTVDNFTIDVLLNHFMKGDFALETIPNNTQVKSLGGRTLNFTRKKAAAFVNGIPVVLESEILLPRGRIYKVSELLFVDYDRVEDLRHEFPYLEKAPLLGGPWPTSQFLSHLLLVTEKETTTSLFAQYLNLTNLAGLVPTFDDEFSDLSYTALIPHDETFLPFILEGRVDPFLEDDVLRTKVLMNHIVKGTLTLEDMIDGATFSTLLNNTLTCRVRKSLIKLNNVKVLEFGGHLYNLGSIFVVDGLLGVTEKDISKSLNKTVAKSKLEILQNDNEVDTTEASKEKEVVYETRTEISISRKVDDGDEEFVTKFLK